MFKFLKEKLKSAISKISESVEKEGKIEETAENPIEETAKEEKHEKGFFARLKEKFAGAEEAKETSEAKNREIGYAKEEAKPEKEIKPGIGIKEAPKIIGHKKAERQKQEPKAEAKKGASVIRQEIKEEKKPEIRQAQKEETEQPIKKPEEKPAEAKEEPQKITEKEPEKKGFFESIKERITTTKIDERQFDRMFRDMEMALMENNVAIEAIEKIKNSLKERLVEKPIKRARVEETVQEALKTAIEGLFLIGNADLTEEIANKKEKPYVIAFFGINGSGKTTSIAKLASMLKSKNISCVLAASDTFRAASIEQLSLHAEKIGVKIIKHSYGADPAAVAFDAIKHAKAKNVDVVLIDTAGRMQSNKSLVDEMKKIIRVAKPDLKIFVGESITGNDCIEQAKTFNEAVGIDGIILAKADIDEKGGAAVSVSYVTKKPILFLGTGQEYKDLEKFDREKIMRNIGLD